MRHATEANASVRLVVKQGRTELDSWTVDIQDGAVVRCDRTDPGAGAEPDIAFTFTPDDAAAMREGALSLSVGFMRGQVKMAGDYGKLLRVLPILDGAEFASRRAALFSPA
jgi:hypothetical protein